MQLPACKNCQTADAECLFWDHALGQEMPCSYLYSLDKKVSSLKREIQQVANRHDPVSVAVADVASSGSDLQLEYFSIPREDGASSSPGAYLGPGNSARLFERLMKAMVDCHKESNNKLPERFIAQEVEPLEPSRSFPSFPIAQDSRKIDYHSLVPPSTQRAILEYYAKFISSEYELLPIELETSFSKLENPLKTTSAEQEPDGASITIAFAISSAMIARDLDPSLCNLSKRWREGVRKLSQGVVLMADARESVKWTCISLTAMALCELISPTSDQLWELLGAAVSALDDLREGYELDGLNLDHNFRRLERSLLKLEGSCCSHYRLPSAFLETRLQSAVNDISSPSAILPDLMLLNHLNVITHKLTILPHLSVHVLESLIPLSLQVALPGLEGDISSATLYLVLHPFLTTSKTISGEPLDTISFRLFCIIANSARIVIDHLADLHYDHKIISLWMTTERLFESGLVWATFLVSQRYASRRGCQDVPHVDMGTAMGPLLKVSSLLASFSMASKGGAAYVDAWEAFLELFWHMFDYDGRQRGPQSKSSGST